TDRNEVVLRLEQIRVIAHIDGNALAKYCQLWTRWKKAELFIEERGDIYPLKDDMGRIKCFQQFPQVAIAHRLALALTRMEAEFGMRPSERSRINVPIQARALPEDPRLRLFKTRPSIPG